MPRVSMFNSPLLLGFDHFESMIDQLTKTGGDGYPPYNIEQVSNRELRITLAVAGFSEDDLQISLEQNQLSIKGRQQEDSTRAYLHRGIAARQFQKRFVLAEGIEVLGAEMDNGLLYIDLARPEPTNIVQKINIRKSGGKKNLKKVVTSDMVEEQA